MKNNEVNGKGCGTCAIGNMSREVAREILPDSRWCSRCARSGRKKGWVGSGVGGCRFSSSEAQDGWSVAPYV